MKYTHMLMILIFCCGFLYAQKKTTIERNPKVSNKSLFSQRSKIMSLPFKDTKYGLTHIPSDMGADEDLVPKPIKILPGKGIYLINPAPDFQPKSSFMKIAFDGTILFKIDLPQILGFAEGDYFATENIFLYPDDKSCVLYAKSYNSETNLNFDFEAAFFDSNGKLIRKIILPTLADYGLWHILSDGKMWAYSKTSPAQSWVLFSPDGEVIHKITANHSGTVLFDGTLLCFLTDTTGIICDISGNKTPVSFINKSVSEDLFGRGTANFSGIISTQLDTEAQNAVKIDINFQSFYYEPNKKKIIFLPKAELNPCLTTLQDIPVEWYDLPTFTLDNSGNLYYVLRSCNSNCELIIYKMNIDTDIVKNFIGD